MGTRNVSRATIAAALIVLCPLLALGQEKTEQPPTKAQTSSATMQKAAGQSATDAKSAVKVANSLAVCRCGMVFAPTTSTQSFTHEGSQYMVCSDVCYKTASSDPTQAAKDTQGYVRKFIAQASTPSTGGTAPKPN